MDAAQSASLGRYQILKEIGSGAMGVVYLARDPLIDRQIALKTLRLERASARDGEETQMHRFLDEARSAGILSHPNIVTVHDISGDGNGEPPFIAMEYVRGTTLRSLLQKERSLSLELASRVTGQVAAALDHAHEKGIVHGDLKPSNILITPDRRVKVADFGIAHFGSSSETGSQPLYGTPGYVSPEQLRGSSGDSRSDVFALGVMAYEMITGRRPFTGRDVPEVLHRIAHRPYTPPERHVPDLPSGVSRVLAKALRKSPTRRYQTAGDLAEELQQALPPDPGDRDDVTTQDLSGLRSAERGWITWLRDALADTREALAGPVQRLQRAPALEMSPRRILLSSSMALLGALACGWLALWWLSPGEPLSILFSEEHLLRLRYVPLLKEGRLQLRAGEPEAAEQTFALAERLAPGVSVLSEWRERARAEALELEEYRAVERRVAELVAESRVALASGYFRRAQELAAEALELDPERQSAAAIASRAWSARRSAGRPPPPPEPKPLVSEPVALPTAAPAEPAVVVASAPAEKPSFTDLKIGFSSRLPRGVLTIYANGSQILNQPFRFLERKGLLRRQGTDERIQEIRRLAADETTFLIYVTPAGRRAGLTSLETDLSSGGTRSLEIEVDLEGKIAAVSD